MAILFSDRDQAGALLAQNLCHYADRRDVIVLGLPRGGVPVAYQIAKRLRAPLDVFVVRKLGVPGFEELAVGAIASGGVRVINSDILGVLPNGAETVELVAAREEAELKRRENLYRGDRPGPDLRARVVILVDDGFATGATMRAAIAALRQREVAQIVVAVPVGAPETCRELQKEADELVCLLAPESFYAVGQYYTDFSQITDDQVRELLGRANPG